MPKATDIIPLTGALISLYVLRGLPPFPGLERDF